MSEKHTPGTLTFHPQGDADEYCLIMSDGRWVIGFRQNGEICVDEQMANARRIVAAWNHCAGFTTEQVKAVSMKDLVAVARLLSIADRILDGKGDYDGRQRHAMVETLIIKASNLADDLIAKLEAAG